MWRRLNDASAAATKHSTSVRADVAMPLRSPCKKKCDYVPRIAMIMTGGMDSTPQG
jgi:hypothetical protein